MGREWAVSRGDRLYLTCFVLFRRYFLMNTSSSDMDISWVKLKQADNSCPLRIYPGWNFTCLIGEYVTLNLNLKNSFSYQVFCCQLFEDSSWYHDSCCYRLKCKHFLNSYNSSGINLKWLFLQTYFEQWIHSLICLFCSLTMPLDRCYKFLVTFG